MSPSATPSIPLRSSTPPPPAPDRKAGHLPRSLSAGLALAFAAGLACPVLAATAPPTAPLQDTSPGQHPGQRSGGGQYAGMGRAGGEVTSVAGNTLTVKGENGRAVQVVTTDNTRVMKDNGPVRVADLHVGDGLMAIGNLDPATGTLHAAMVMATDASELKAMRENLGKTYITGRVTAINLDDAKMTVERPDHVAQTIGFDESTSFKRAVRAPRNAGNGGEGRGPGSMGGGMGLAGGMGLMAGGGAALDQAFAGGESITLADIKVGDSVIGTGTLKSGVFVPVHLLENPPRQPRVHANGPSGAGEPAGGVAAPGAAGPGTR